jgi:8-oxo-dGTP pyrophosphatase MutT (NUDIX family)
MVQERAEPLGAARRTALALFARLPRRARVRIVRLLTPAHTVGAVCLLEHDGRLLLLDQHHRPGWTLPGGLLNRGETAAQAVVREVHEETGLRISVDLPVTAIIDPSSRRVDVLFHVPLDRQVPVVPRGEAARAAWLSPQEAGVVDDATAAVFAALERWRLPGTQRGRLT